MGIAYNTSIVRDGLVLHLDAANVKSYPGTGTTWSDLSGNGNNGTLVNGPLYSSDNNGILAFDGTDDYVSETVGLSDSFWQGDFTASFWVKFDTINTSTNYNSDKTLLQHGSNSNSRGLHLSQRRSRVHFGLYGDDLEGSAILSTNTWYNITYALNNTSFLKQIYINTVLDNDQTGGAYIGTGNNTRIFGRVLSFGNTFDGDVGLCNFYNRVLTESEIQQNFEALRGRYGI